MRKVIYTAIIGNYDTLPKIHKIDADIDYICFTNSPEIVSDGLWKIRRIEPVFADPQRDARRYKLLPHLFLPEYDLSLWMDALIEIRGYPDNLINEILADNVIAVPDHPDRTCIYKEAEQVLDYDVDDAAVVRKQMYRYRLLGFPENYGLHQTSIVCRIHNAPQCILFNELWWQELSNNSKRDQLSFDFVRWLTHTEVQTPDNKELYSERCFFRDNSGQVTHLGNRFKFRQFWASPSLSISLVGQYKEQSLSRSFLLNVQNLLKSESPKNTEGFLPLPTQNSALARNSFTSLVMPAHKMLILGDISPSWVMLAGDVNERIDITWIKEPEVSNAVHGGVMVETLLPDRIHYAFLSFMDLLQLDEISEFFQSLSLIIIGGIGKNKLNLMHGIWPLLHPGTSVVIWPGEDDEQGMHNLLVQLYHIKRCGPFSIFIRRTMV